jgi:hypothetical protein
MKTKIELGESVGKSVYSSVSSLVQYPIRKSTWRPINNLTRWSVRL